MQLMYGDSTLEDYSVTSDKVMTIVDGINQTATAAAAASAAAAATAAPKQPPTPKTTAGSVR